MPSVQTSYFSSLCASSTSSTEIEQRKENLTTFSQLLLKMLEGAIQMIKVMALRAVDSPK